MWSVVIPRPRFRCDWPPPLFACSHMRRGMPQRQIEQGFFSYVRSSPTDMQYEVMLKDHLQCPCRCRCCWLDGEQRFGWTKRNYRWGQTYLCPLTLCGQLLFPVRVSVEIGRRLCSLVHTWEGVCPNVEENKELLLCEVVVDRADACEVCDLVSEDVYLRPTLSTLPLSARLLAPTGP